jgi:hypothetical protein
MLTEHPEPASIRVSPSDSIRVMHCRACHHPDRDKVDADLVAGVPVRQIHALTGLSLGGLTRHKEHVREIIRERQPSERAELAVSLVSRVERVINEAETILSTAKACGDLKAAVAALNANLKALEMIGRASGELAANGGGIHLHAHRTTVTNVTVEPGSDEELAALISEATHGYDTAEIQRLKTIAERGNTTLLAANAT